MEAMECGSSLMLVRLLLAIAGKAERAYTVLRGGWICVTLVGRMGEDSASLYILLSLLLIGGKFKWNKIVSKVNGRGLPQGKL